MTLNEVAPLGGSFRAATGTAAAAAAAAFAADAGVVADADAGAFEDAGEVARLLLGDAALGVDGVEGAFRDGDRDARAEGGIELDADIYDERAARESGWGRLRMRGAGSQLALTFLRVTMVVYIQCTQTKPNVPSYPKYILLARSSWPRAPRAPARAREDGGYRDACLCMCGEHE
jgi:hypothetical protein